LDHGEDDGVVRIGAYLELCNRRRPQQSLDNRTPNEVFYELPLAA
jgi:hypothetical protein